MILVVDDHEDTRRVITRLLRLEGYHSFGAADGKHALALLRVVRPQLMILDYGLPDMNGIDLFRKIQNMPGAESTRAIMFTAQDDPLGLVRDEALTAGIKSYLVKGSLDWAKLRHEVVRFAGTAGVPPVFVEGPKRWTT